MAESKRVKRALVLGALVIGVVVGAVGSAALSSKEKNGQTSSAEKHLVRAGDTYARIVADRGLSCLGSELAEANGTADLEAGSIVSIPGFCRSAPSATTAAAEPTMIAESPSQPSVESSDGVGFVESFDGAAGLDRFSSGIYHRGDEADGTITWPEAALSWSADHDNDCGTPETQRSIQRDDPAGSLFVCRDHLMTSIGDTDGYSTGWFSPKQVFAGQTEVAWDVNLTDLGGRQWWEVTIVPASFDSGVPTCPQCSAHPDFANVAGLPAYPAESVVVSTIGRGLSVSTDGTDREVASHYQIRDFDAEAADSKAIRRPFSVTDNEDGTITVNFGDIDTFTVPGAFPDEFVVLFKDHNYTPDKDGPVAGYTWHWDSIAIQ